MQYYGFIIQQLNGHSSRQPHHVIVSTVSTMIQLQQYYILVLLYMNTAPGTMFCCVRMAGRLSDIIFDEVSCVCQITSSSFYCLARSHVASRAYLCCLLLLHLFAIFRVCLLNCSLRDFSTHGHHDILQTASPFISYDACLMHSSIYTILLP